MTLLPRPVDGGYVAVTRVHGPDWWWVTVYPEDLLAASAHEAARLIFLLGLGPFLLVLAVAYWILRRKVAHPVAILTSAAEAIGRGDYARVADGEIPVPEVQRNEIGLLARTVRRMARNLREADEQDDAIFVLDREGRLHDANPAAARMTGRPTDELLSMTIFELAVGADRDELRQVLTTLGSGESERLGFETHAAADGAEAIRVVRESGGVIDTVLLDLSMPGMDGIEVCRELQALDPYVRVWMTSGYTEQEVLGKLRGTTVSGFIQKPFSIESLRRLRG